MFELIRANKTKSWILIVVLTAVLVALGYVVGSVWTGSGAVGVVIAVIIAVVLTCIAFFAGDKAMLAMSHAHEIQKRDAPQLFNVVEEMSIAGMMPMPKVYVIDDEALNAFATGRKPENASVAITKGLLMRLNRDELQGVIAHEMSHIRNHDILFMTLAGVMVGAIALLADAFLRGMWLTGGRRRRSSRDSGGGAQAILLIIGIIAAILAPIVARLLYLACSRRREYLADASAAQLTRYPEGLASALEKLTQDRQPLQAANRATAPMYIVNPVASLRSGGASLFSTHPPTQDRIAILRAMGNSASMVAYEQAWKKSHPGEGLASAAGIKEASKEAAVRKPVDKPTPRETPKKRLERAHQALDMVRRVGGFLFLPCACGAQLKIPPSYKRPQVRCPRCGGVHNVSDARSA